MTVPQLASSWTGEVNPERAGRWRLSLKDRGGGMGECILEEMRSKWRSGNQVGIGPVGKVKAGVAGRGASTGEDLGADSQHPPPPRQFFMKITCLSSGHSSGGSHGSSGTKYRTDVAMALSRRGASKTTSWRGEPLVGRRDRKTDGDEDCSGRTVPLLPGTV